jgi:hypothetical protein
MAPALRRWFIPAVPLVLAVLLLFHPRGDGGRIYDGVSGVADRWLAVHVGLAVLVGLLAVAVYLLLEGLRGRAATVSRVALLPFVVCFVAWEANAGIGTAILVDYADGLPAAEREPVAGAIQELWTNPFVGEPSVFNVIGNLSWVVAMIAAAVAFSRAGAARAVTVLLAISSLFVFHALVVGSVALLCLAAAAVLVERARTQPAPTAAAPPAGVAPAGT